MVGLGLALGVAAGACRGSSAFVCTGDGDCDDEGTPGRCEDTGFCSFPDQECPSMQRYGKHAGGLSGECVPSGEGTGTGTPGETTLTLDGSGAASSDATATGSGGPTLEFVDDDEQDFTAGELTQLAWLDGGVQLSESSTGTLVSRVFDAGEPVAWRTLSWTPRAPYGKPLPDEGLSERGYAQDNVDMSGNLLLLHLEGQGQVSPGELLVDSSGLAHDFVLEASASLPWVPGPFGSALADDMESYARNGEWMEAFSFEEDDFTWSMWARSDVPCDGLGTDANQVYLGIEGQGSERSHLWLGCRHPTSSHCPGDRGAGRPGGSYAANQTVGGSRVCGSSELVDDRWHHLVVTKSGHADAEVALYFDGVVDDADPFSYADPIEFAPGTELALGAFSDGTFPAAGTFDEVAIWRRSLSYSEVQSLYRRGVLRLRIQVRACDDPQCTDGEFVGPDGGPETVFEDVLPELGPADALVLPDELVGQYFQYRVELEGASGSSPVLERVALEAAIP